MIQDNLWRPDDWPPEIDISGFTGLPETIEEMLQRYSHFFEAGASAMLEALIKWLFEPCAEHRQYSNAPDLTKMEYTVGINTVRYKHRYLCPQCMAEINKELGI
jgi:hypothetical protein